VSLLLRVFAKGGVYPERLQGSRRAASREKILAQPHAMRLIGFTRSRKGEKISISKMNICSESHTKVSPKPYFHIRRRPKAMRSHYLILAHRKGQASGQNIIHDWNIK
jgi:hypothetical protein